MVLALALGAGTVACAPIRQTSADPAQTPMVSHPHYLMLRVGERRLYLMDGQTRLAMESFPIAVGRAGHETPTGRFEVFEKIEYPEYEKIDPKDRSRILKRIPPGPENPLGERWIGIARGEGWTVGIHGTPRPELLGKAVSGGCIRMRNADVIRIYDRVSLGTPVIVEP